MGAEAAIAEARTFFLDLHHELIERPLTIAPADQLRYDRHLEEVYQRLAALATQGSIDNMGTARATYEAVAPREQRLTSQITCNNVQGFFNDDAPMAFAWEIRDGLEGEPNGGLFCDTKGRLGWILNNGMQHYDYIDDPGIGLSLLMAREAVFFSPRRAIRQITEADERPGTL